MMLAHSFHIFVAALIAFLIGALWYSPVLFAKAWVRANGFTPEKLAAMAPGSEGSDRGQTGVRQWVKRGSDHRSQMGHATELIRRSPSPRQRGSRMWVHPLL